MTTTLRQLWSLIAVVTFALAAFLFWLGAIKSCAFCGGLGVLAVCLLAREEAA